LTATFLLLLVAGFFARAAADAGFLLAMRLLLVSNGCCALTARWLRFLDRGGFYPRLCLDHRV